MGQATSAFTLDTLLRKKIEKRRRKEKDARVHNRLSALLWLANGYSPEHIVTLLGVCPRTIRNWLDIYQRAGLDALCTLDYKGDLG
jgi:transposase